MISRPRRKILARLLAAVLLVVAYPAFVLGFTWYHIWRSDLPGGRHGPLDAYRHALASAVVAFTLTPRVVEWTSSVMEDGGKGSNAMDQHNTRRG